MRRRALLVTVGTGTRPDVNIVRPLVKTIRDSRPDFLVLLVTEASLNHGQEILSQLNWPQDAQMTVLLKDFDDFQAVFREVNQVFRRLNELGFAPEEVQVDFTSGTKAMSSGAVSAGIFHQCESLKYITGERRHGVVVDNTEKFITVQPAAIYARHDLRLARELILRLRFATAEEILRDLNPNLLDAEEQELHRNLRRVTHAYRAWDMFHHTDCRSRFDKVSWEVLRGEPFRPSAAALTLLDRLAGREEQSRSEALLLDLYNNACRRGLEGKFDDAVARLYRAAELLAQQLLSGPPYHLNSSDLDLTRVPASLRDLLERSRDDTDGKIKIGLHLDYLLLAELGHPVGRAFMENKPLRNRLSERNQSILAHGLKPVTQSLFNRLKSDLVSLISTVIPDFESQAAQTQFPWL
ncbi:MAG: TIGR02710 family CRISPR-associated protein [Deltaproteobacteria bacterium]|nr:TIGR02710 family CRISPR-associated protein [Deltaproteobacteria bacterium]